MAIYSMNIDRFAGPKSDTPWKPSPAMKMRQAAVADRVQTSAKQGALDLRNDAANAGLKRQVEAATLRQQLASFYNPSASSPNRQGVAAALPPPNRQAAMRNQPRMPVLNPAEASQGLASRSGLSSVQMNPKAGQVQTKPYQIQRLPTRARAGGHSGRKGVDRSSSSSSSDSMGPKFGRATGANPDYGMVGGGGGVGAVRRPAPRSSGPWASELAATQRESQKRGSLQPQYQREGGSMTVHSSKELAGNRSQTPSGAFSRSNPGAGNTMGSTSAGRGSIGRNKNRG
jgi:hypothetical protein